MPTADAATRHVVDRCPSCGVEHEVRAHACEACATPLRAWCRVHGRETGWLDGAACARCAEETARTPRPMPVPADEPVFKERGPVAALLVGVWLTILAVIGVSGLLLSLTGFIVLLSSGGETGAPLILALAFVFAGSLLGLAVVVDAVRKPTGRRDPP